MLRLLFCLLNLTLWCAISAQDHCTSSIIVTHMNDEAFSNGIPLGKFDKTRGDGYPAFGYRFYQLIKVRGNVTEADTSKACRMERFLESSGSFCEDQYFFRDRCDTTLEKAQEFVNRMLSTPRNGHQEFDIYRYPRVYMSNDTLWSVEINEVYMQWDDAYAEQVEEYMNYLRFLQNDPFLDPKIDFSGRAPETPVHWTHQAERGYFGYMLKECEPCKQAKGGTEDILVNPNDPKDYRYLGHYEAFSFDPRDMRFYTIDELGDETLRQRIYNEVVRWQENHPQFHINSYHYKPELKRDFMYLVGDNAIVVYLGEEGEFRGHHRIFVPRFVE